MFSEVAWRVEAVRDLGEDRVLVLGHLHARGRISGAEVSSEIGHLFELREGRCYEAGRIQAISRR
jgi:hypothetical protein